MHHYKLIAIPKKFHQKLLYRVRGPYLSMIMMRNFPKTLKKKNKWRNKWCLRIIRKVALDLLLLIQVAVWVSSAAAPNDKAYQLSTFRIKGKFHNRGTIGFKKGKN